MCRAMTGGSYTDERMMAAPQETSAVAGAILCSVRLTPDEIEFIARKIVKTLVAEEKLETESERQLIEGLTKVITEEMHVEDRLNEEVREVLIQHASEMERSNITYTEMFKMVKRKLAKEKGIVL